VFGNCRASSAAAWALGDLVGVLVSELVVTEPRCERNGSVTTSRTIQKITGYQGWRTIQPPSWANARAAPRPPSPRSRPRIGASKEGPR